VQAKIGVAGVPPNGRLPKLRIVREKNHIAVCELSLLNQLLKAHQVSLNFHRQRLVEVSTRAQHGASLRKVLHYGVQIKCSHNFTLSTA
jgi:hypothetical protein